MYKMDKSILIGIKCNYYDIDYEIYTLAAETFVGSNFCEFHHFNTLLQKIKQANVFQYFFCESLCLGCISKCISKKLAFEQ